MKLSKGKTHTRETRAVQPQKKSEFAMAEWTEWKCLGTYLGAPHICEGKQYSVIFFFQILGHSATMYRNIMRTLFYLAMEYTSDAVGVGRASLSGRERRRRRHRWSYVGGCASAGGGLRRWRDGSWRRAPGVAASAAVISGGVSSWRLRSEPADADQGVCSGSSSLRRSLDLSQCCDDT